MGKRRVESRGGAFLADDVGGGPWTGLLCILPHMQPVGAMSCEDAFKQSTCIGPRTFVVYRSCSAILVFVQRLCCTQSTPMLYPTNAFAMLRRQHRPSLRFHDHVERGLVGVGVTVAGDRAALMLGRGRRVCCALARSATPLVDGVCSTALDLDRPGLGGEAEGSALKAGGDARLTVLLHEAVEVIFHLQRVQRLGRARGGGLISAGDAADLAVLVTRNPGDEGSDVGRVLGVAAGSLDLAGGCVCVVLGERLAKHLAPQLLGGRERGNQ